MAKLAWHAGQTKFLNSTVDYTIGDYQLSSSLYASAGRPIVQFPISLGAVALYHNITGYFSPNTLRLNSALAAQIFTGNITYWDDPQILAINPNLTYVTSTTLWSESVTSSIHTLHRCWSY